MKLRCCHWWRALFQTWLRKPFLIYPKILLLLGSSLLQGSKLLVQQSYLTLISLDFLHMTNSSYTKLQKIFRRYALRRLWVEPKGMLSTIWVWTQINILDFVILFRSTKPTPPIPSSAFKVLCKFILKKQSMVIFKVVINNLVITKFLQTTLRFIINCFLSKNLQRTLKAVGGIGGVLKIKRLLNKSVWRGWILCVSPANAKNGAVVYGGDCLDCSDNQSPVLLKQVTGQWLLLKT